MPLSPAQLQSPAASSPLATALSACRGAFIAIAIFSGVINVLLLTGSLYMLQVYDRVLPSRSVATLLALSALAIGLYSFQGLLEWIRSRMLARIGRSLDEALSGRVYETIVALPLRARSSGDGLQALRDLDQVRLFLSSVGPTALFDMPWMPLYMGLCFAFHYWIGITALIGAAILITLTLLTEALSRKPTRAAAGFGAARMMLAETSRRNSEVLRAMGMSKRLMSRWSAANAKYMAAQEGASDVAGGLGSASKVLRMALQSAVLAVGAYLTIFQEATPGIIIASSILVSRALAPIELAIAHWRNFVSARQGWRRLSELLGRIASGETPMALPAPHASLGVEAVTIVPPGQQNAVVQNLSFRMVSGQGLGIIGPSAAGKSSLARAVVGVWQPSRGKIRLDSAALDQWGPDDLGQHIGYVPQDVELFDGTVAENIARFIPDPDPTTIVAAAQAAGVHEMILRLPDGYESQIGEGGATLSAGQRQRLALARALYGDPFLVVLDEPNSNLDSEGDQALTRAILGVRERGGVVIVIAHRPTALAGVDLVLAMANGQSQAFGPKEEVLRKVLQTPRAVTPLPKVVGDVQGHSS